MFSKFMKLSVVPVLAASLFLSACENGGDPTQGLMGPESIGAPAFEVIETVLPDGYKVVEETDPSVGYISSVVGARGGSLQIGSHKIDIPAGAVTSETTFTLIKPEANKLSFSLRAARNGDDVGAAGFEKPIKLVISYEGTGISDPSGLVIGWVLEDGTEFQSTQISTSRKTATTNLNHFSDYTLLMP